MVALSKICSENLTLSYRMERRDKIWPKTLAVCIDMGHLRPPPLRIKDIDPRFACTNTWRHQLTPAWFAFPRTHPPAVRCRFDKTAGNPLHMSLTFLCPIVGVGMGNAGTLDSATGGGGAAASGVTLSTTAMRARVPTTFSVLVPKFYPHEPPMLYTDR